MTKLYQRQKKDKHKHKRIHDHKKFRRGDKEVCLQAKKQALILEAGEIPT